MLYFPVVCASVWCAISIEMAWESARTDGRALVLFGHVVAAPPVSATIVILCAVSAAAALAMAIAVGYARRRRLEHPMAAELDARWAELAEGDAGDGAPRGVALAAGDGGDAAGRGLPNWRLAELQTLVDQLLADRKAAAAKERHLIV